MLFGFKFTLVKLHTYYVYLEFCISLTSANESSIHRASFITEEMIFTVDKFLKSLSITSICNCTMRKIHRPDRQQIDKKDIR